MPRRAAALVVSIGLVCGTAGAEAAQPGLNGLLAYDAGGNPREPTRILTVRPDGTSLRQLTASRRPSRSPAWSPDGQALAFVAGDFTELGPVVVAERGRRTRRLTRIGEEPVWSPDGAEIAYLDFLDGDDVKIARADGVGRVRTLPVPGAGDLYSLSWSPDGGLIAVGGDAAGLHDACCIFAVSARGGEPRTLVEEPARTTAEHPLWSPDGRTVAFNEIENCRGRTCSGPVHVVLVDRDGRNRRRLLSNAGVGAWSPDGRFLLVYVFRPRSGLFTLELATGTRRLAVAGTGFARVDWQPRCHRLGNGRPNRLRGSAEPELVCGLGGADEIDGGRGSDRLLGGRGDDAIDARDGGFDVVGCGAGRDVVRADRRDRVGVDCERVVRRAR
ncbi:MAG: hypothetical protein M3321_04005 [Actinomycetota bacterium]|nr:hypothetical protein [Actinomycetota bacterium]